MTQEAAVTWLVPLVSPIPLTPSDSVPKIERYGEFCHFLCSSGGWYQLCLLSCPYGQGWDQSRLVVRPSQLVPCYVAGEPLLAGVPAHPPPDRKNI